jgi:hypothetical protein
MERNSSGALSGALRAPDAFGASGTSGSSCDHLELLAPHWHHARLLAPSGGAAARPPAAPAPPAPLSAAFGRTAVLPNPASLAGDRDGTSARAVRYTRGPPTDAGFE